MSIYDKFHVIDIANVVIIATYTTRLVTEHDNCHMKYVCILYILRI